MGRTTLEESPGPGQRWWLPVILALIIIAVLAGVFFKTHPDVFGGGSATSTPTAQPITATPQPGPTGTPRPGPTATPRPSPTATPKPTATLTPTPTLTPMPTPTP